MPDSIKFRQLCHHVYAFQTKSDELAKEGKDDAAYRGYFKRYFGLGDREASSFNAITLQCGSQMKNLDDRFRNVMRAFRQQHPAGLQSGGVIAPLPAEVYKIEAQRQAVALRAKEQLANELSPAGYLKVIGDLSHTLRNGAAE